MAGFLRRVGSLGTATALGQGLVALNLVILARLLGQEDVGHYSVFVSYAMILLPVSLLSYEVLIPNLPEEEVPVLLQGVVPLAFALVVLAAVGFAAFDYPHAWPLAALLLSMAFIRLVEFAAIRIQRIGAISLARTLPHALFMAMLSTLAMSGGTSLESVLWSQVAAFALPAMALAWRVLGRWLAVRPNWSRTGALLRNRWRNPLLLAPSEIATTTAWNLPVVLVAQHFGEAMAAQYGVMLRYALAPVGLVNSVVGNVYHAELADGVRARNPAISARFAFMRRRMFFLGLATGIATALCVPPALRLLLGPGWDTAEQLVFLMAPLVAVAVWVAPFGVAFYVFEHARELLLLNLAFVLIAVAAFTLVTDDLRLAVAAFVVLAIGRFLLILARVGSMIQHASIRPCPNASSQ